MLGWVFGGKDSAPNNIAGLTVVVLLALLVLSPSYALPGITAATILAAVIVIVRDLLKRRDR